MSEAESLSGLEKLSRQSIRPIEWRDDVLYLLDQRKLPLEELYIPLHTAAEVAKAIQDMVVRGAPAIGITAAYGIALAAKRGDDLDVAYEVLADSRPTAVNLHWALARMRVVGSNAAALLNAAVVMHIEDLEQNLYMAGLGASCFEGEVSVLTHCNTGSLATAGHGTALGVIRTAHALGKLKSVYAGETRPWLQGARLTAWELTKEGIDAQLIADSAAASLMVSGAVDWVVVGADRIAANGDVANKIGTYSLAVLAKHHGVKFMVVAPTGTIDVNTQTGSDIPIEQRSADELLTIGGIRMAAQGVDAWNPVFDVTPAGLVDVLVTERGLVNKPEPKKINELMVSESEA